MVIQVGMLSYTTTISSTNRSPKIRFPIRYFSFRSNFSNSLSTLHFSSIALLLLFAFFPPSPFLRLLFPFILNIFHFSFVIHTPYHHSHFFPLCEQILSEPGQSKRQRSNSHVIHCFFFKKKIHCRLLSHLRIFHIHIHINVQRQISYSVWFHYPTSTSADVC